MKPEQLRRKTMPGILETITPTERERQSASDGSHLLSRFLDSREPVHLRVSAATEPDAEVVLPPDLVRILHEVLSRVAEGRDLTVVPRRAEFTTSEAAEILGVSRPHLIKLLETGQIAYRRVGEKRRIPSDDLLHYRDQHKEKRLSVLADLQAQAQELDMGY
jgi:excisionase family DNA binding protein